MSFRGYKKKHGPALWVGAFPGQVTQTARSLLDKLEPPRRKFLRPVSKSKSAERRLYTAEARAFVRELAKAGVRCPVFAAFDILPPEIQRFLTFCRAGTRKPDNVSEVHHTRGRRGRLLRDRRFWVGLSKWGHRAVHAFPDMARKHGWLCPVGQWNTTPEDFLKKLLTRSSVSLRLPP